MLSNIKRKKSIAGVVTLYNPQDDVYENIMTYIHALDILYVMDNSETINEELVKKITCLQNVEYIKNKYNLGIAKSLNIALDMACFKYKWLLTMDQDSSFHSGGIESYFDFLVRMDEKKNYAITCLRNGQEALEAEASRTIYQERAITSGMIVNVQLAYDCDGFDEKLFIDEVDYEFCYRCNAKGYKLQLYPVCIMNHTIGEPIFNNIAKPVSWFLGKKSFEAQNEKPFRLYYIYRNSLYVASKYGMIRKYYYSLLKRLVKIIFAEPDKREKINYIVRGISDYYLGKMGKLE